MTPIIYYLHGFKSSPAAYKARCLGQYLAEFDCTYRVPSLSFNCQQVISDLNLILQQDLPATIILVGSSLGGFYATYLAEKYQLQAILINPVVQPYKLVQAHLGPTYNDYRKEQYYFTRSDVTAFKQLEVTQISHPERFLVLLQRGDEVLDYRAAWKKYQQCYCWIESGGSHHFDHFEQMLPTIAEFADLKAKPKASLKSNN